jgi:hypothetical protein
VDTEPAVVSALRDGAGLWSRAHVPSKFAHPHLLASYFPTWPSLVRGFFPWAARAHAPVRCSGKPALAPDSLLLHTTFYARVVCVLAGAGAEGRSGVVNIAVPPPPHPTPPTPSRPKPVSHAGSSTLQCDAGCRGAPGPPTRRSYGARKRSVRVGPAVCAWYCGGHGAGTGGSSHTPPRSTPSPLPVPASLGVCVDWYVRAPGTPAVPLHAVWCSHLLATQSNVCTELVGWGSGVGVGLAGHVVVLPSNLERALQSASTGAYCDGPAPRTNHPVPPGKALLIACAGVLQA